MAKLMQRVEAAISNEIESCCARMDVCDYDCKAVLQEEFDHLQLLREKILKNEDLSDADWNQIRGSIWRDVEGY